MSKVKNKIINRLLQFSPDPFYFACRNRIAAVAKTAVYVSKHGRYFIVIERLGRHGAVIFLAVHYQLPGKALDYLADCFFFVSQEI